MNTVNYKHQVDRAVLGRTRVHEMVTAAKDDLLIRGDVTTAISITDSQPYRSNCSSTTFNLVFSF